MASLSTAFLNSAPLKMVRVRFAFSSVTPLRFAPRKLALEKSFLYPFSGVVSSVRTLRSCKMALPTRARLSCCAPCQQTWVRQVLFFRELAKLVLFKLAWLKVAPVRAAPLKEVPPREESVRLIERKISNFSFSLRTCQPTYELNNKPITAPAPETST